MGGSYLHRKIDLVRIRRHMGRPPSTVIETGRAPCTARHSPRCDENYKQLKGRCHLVQMKGPGQNACFLLVLRFLISALSTLTHSHPRGSGVPAHQTLNLRKPGHPAPTEVLRAIAVQCRLGHRSQGGQHKSSWQVRASQQRKTSKMHFH